MHKPLIALFLIVSLAGCNAMKEKMAKMKDKTTNAAQQSEQNAAAAAAAAHHDPMHPLSGGKNNNNGGNGANSGNGAGDASQGGGQGATGGGAASAEVGGAAAGGAASGSAEGTGADASGQGGGGQDPGATNAGGGGDASAGGGDASAAGGGAPVYNPADCTTPTNKPEDVEKDGTERWGWTDAKVGWLIRTRQPGGIEMSQAAIESREKSFLQETKIYSNGAVMTCSRSWTARLMPKVEPAKDQDGKEIQYEQKVTDLPDESVTISGKSYHCKVKKVWSKVAGTESTSTSWTCDEIPGWLVKSVMETDQGPQTVYELVELHM